MSKNDGGPAFPVAVVEADGPVALDDFQKLQGMTLRDWFAGMALQGLLAMCAGAHANPVDSEKAALVAYMHADAMLKERNKQP